MNQEEIEFRYNLKQKLIKNRQLENEIKEKRREIANSYKDIEEYKKQCPHICHSNNNKNYDCSVCMRRNICYT